MIRALLELHLSLHKSWTDTEICNKILHVMNKTRLMLTVKWYMRNAYNTTFGPTYMFVDKINFMQSHEKAIGN